MTDFSIYARKSKKGLVYYVRFKKPDGTYSTAKSTQQKTKKAARQWAKNYLKTTGYILPGQEIVFKIFAQNFYSFEGEWSRSKRITGQRLSEKWIEQRQGFTNRYLTPHFGEMYLHEIKKPIIDEFRNELFYDKQLKGTTINHILTSLKLMLKYAEEKELIAATPTVETVKGNAVKPKEKGTLTIEQIKELYHKVEWSDYKAYIFSLTSVLTGIRKGELLGVQLKNIKDGYIEIQKTYDTQKCRLTETTKNGKHRNIVITDQLYKEIMKLYAKNPYGEPDSFLFYSDILPDKPIDQNVMVRAFFNALKSIGINEQKRKDLNITQHSLRHTFNTVMINAGLPLQIIQATTGHLSEKMTAHYYHVNVQDMDRVKQLQESLLFDRIPVTNENTLN